MGQSLHAGVQIFPSSLFFINPTFCVGSGRSWCQLLFSLMFGLYPVFVSNIEQIMLLLHRDCFSDAIIQ